ncbi:Protein of unknown function, partial [Gryllus bimaculatus]
HIHESLQQRCHENEVHRVCIGRARTLKRWDEMQIKMRKVVGHANADPVNVEVQCELPSLAAPARVQARRHSVGAWSVEAQEPKEHTGTATLPCISNKVFSITHL